MWNPTVILKGIGNALRGAAGSTTLVVKAHAPQIMLGAGLIGFGGTVYSACRATAKTHDILSEKDTAMDEIRSQLAENDLYTPDMAAKDEKAITKKTRIGIIKAYTPTATMGIGSTALILGGFGILNNRYVGATMAYKTLESGFARYRGNVVDKFGEEVDKQMLYTVKKEEMEAALKERDDNKKIQEENKKKKIGKTKPRTKYHDIYTKIFDNYSDRWKRYWTPEMVLDYLRQKEREYNDKLQINGSLFVNEVNDGLGFERTSEGAITGWVKRHGQCPKVSFGLDEMPEEELREILATRRNEDIRVKIRLNPQGIIYNLIDKRSDYEAEAMIN